MIDHQQYQFTSQYKLIGTVTDKNMKKIVEEKIVEEKIIQQ